MAPAQGWHAKSWSVPHFWSAQIWTTSQSVRMTGPSRESLCDTGKQPIHHRFWPSGRHGFESQIWKIVQDWNVEILLLLKHIWDSTEVEPCQYRLGIHGVVDILGQCQRLWVCPSHFGEQKRIFKVGSIVLNTSLLSSVLNQSSWIDTGFLLRPCGETFHVCLKTKQ